jgi:uncharacterized damage-inducible protein DinB
MKRVMSGVVAAAAIVCLPSPMRAQGANPMMDAVKAQFGMVKGVLLKTAEKVPENLWTFRPTPEVRTFAQLIGHVADAQMSICGAAASDKPAALNAEKTMTTKAQLSKALADSVAYCDKVMAGMDDKKAMETTKFFAGGMSPRSMVFAFNTAHSYEHYGNLVTYMRINKIVPPSSEGSGM